MFDSIDIIAVMKTPCRSCNDIGLTSLWNFGEVPHGDSFEIEQEKATKCSLYTLDLGICNSCQLLQLTHDVDIEQIYNNYLYESKVTVGLNVYYRELASELFTTYLKKGDLVVDVGSNDGTFLENFFKLGCQVRGIEPSTKAINAARQKFIPSTLGYLSPEVLSQIQEEYRVRPKVVSFNYVLANMQKPLDALRMVSNVLEEGGIVSIITGYHPKQFDVNQFDYINHDHVCYFRFLDLQSMLENVGLKIVRADLSNHKGGSIHVVAIKSNESVSTFINPEIMKAEVSEVLEQINLVYEMKNRIEIERSKLNKVIDSSELLVGVGASVSTTHFLHQFQLGTKVEFLVDDDVSKQHRFSPLYGLQVFPIEELSGKSGKCIVLAWQHAHTLISRLRLVGFSGTVIVPLPTLEIFEI